VAQRTRDDLRAAVVPVEARLRDNDADLPRTRPGFHRRASLPAGPGRASEQPAQLSQHLIRIFEDLTPAVAGVCVLSGVGLALAFAVLLPRISRVVELVAVELDRERVVGPAAIDPPPAGDPVGLR